MNWKASTYSPLNSSLLHNQFVSRTIFNSGNIQSLVKCNKGTQMNVSPHGITKFHGKRESCHLIPPMTSEKVSSSTQTQFVRRYRKPLIPSKILFYSNDIQGNSNTAYKETDSTNSENSDSKGSSQLLVIDNHHV